MGGCFSQLFSVVDRWLAYGVARMRRKPNKTLRSHQSPAVRVFRVESAQPYGWIVYLDGFPETHFFASRSLAISYARDWAKRNAPSEIHVLGPGGLIEHRRNYGSPRSSDGPVSSLVFT
jgi:Uncharacterized protein conserved in bacteria (DUF2188)